MDNAHIPDDKFTDDTDTTGTTDGASTPSGTTTTTAKKKLSTKAKALIAAGVAAVVVAATAITVVTVQKVEKANAASAATAASTALTKKIEKIYTEDYQTSAATKLAAKKAADTYTVDNMLVVQNPYGTNTTSLYVYFTTTDATSVKYTVSAPSTDYPDFSATAYQKSTYQTSHEFSVLGLIPNTTNTITFTIKSKAGKTVTKSITYKMGSLLGNEEVQVKQTKTTSGTKVSDGLYAILGNDSDGQDYMFYYDNSGVLRGEVPILYYRAHRLLFKNGLMYFSASTHDIVAMNRLGKIEKFYTTTSRYLLHHDYAMDSDGNLVVLATDTKASTIQDRIITINAKSGKITRVVNMAALMCTYEETTVSATMGSSSTESTAAKTGGDSDADTSDCASKTVVSDSESSTTATDPDDRSDEEAADSGTSTTKDWLHLNTIQLLPDGSAVLSSRETSTIIKLKNIETGTPSIGYMIGTTSFWKGTDFAKYLLKKDTSDGDWTDTGGQHTVTYEADDSLPSGQYYLYMFDNNYGSSNTRPDYDWNSQWSTMNTTMDEDDDANNGDTYSHYYKYLVDENKGTYKLVQSIDLPYSAIVSSTQDLDDGTILTDSGYSKGTWGVYSSDGTLLQQYKMTVLKNIIYRVYKYDFTGFYFS